jgi:hypothetical protein
VASVGEPRLISEVEIDACRTLFNLSALAVENAQLFESARRRSDKLAALNALGRQVNQTLSLDEVVTEAIREMVETVQTDMAFLFLREGEKLTLAGIGPKGAAKKFGEMPEHRVGSACAGWPCMKANHFIRGIFSPICAVPGKSAKRRASVPLPPFHCAVERRSSAWSGWPARRSAISNRRPGPGDTRQPGRQRHPQRPVVR